MLTFHHIVIDGWSLPILLQEIFASYFGQRLPAAAPYRNFVSWLAGQDRDAARAAWREVFDGFDTPTLVGRRRPVQVRAASESYRVSAETTEALGELARSCHTTVNTVLQAALGAAADGADRPARRRLRHRGVGTAGRAGRAPNRWSAC